MSMKLSVKNILGLREAEMPIAGITIVAARNGAGKSSLLQALAAAALAEPKMRGVNRKSEFSRIVRDGEAAGSVTLDWGDGWQRVIYPDGTFDSGGRSMPAPVTALGIGHTRLSALKPAERAQAVGALFGGEATVKDLAAFLLKASDGEISEAQAQAQAAATWEKRIVVNGWEACHNAAAEHATKLKGAWQQASGGQMFGAVKSRGWRPDILRPDREYTVEEAEAAVAVAREDLEKRIGDAAVSDTYLLKLQAEASRVPELKEQVEPLRQSVTEQTAVVERLRGDVVKAPLISDDQKPLSCPHCQQPFLLTHAASGRLVPSAVSPKMTIEAIKDANLRHNAASDAYRAARRFLDELTGKLDPLQEALANAEKAARRLHGKSIDDDHTRAARAEAKEKLAALENIAEAVRQMAAAGKVFTEWAALQPMLNALSPGGVRREAARRAINGFNAALATLAGAAGIAPVTMDEDSGLYLGDRAYALCSESEQWRVDALTALVLGQREGAPFVALDRLDVIVADQRVGILKAAMKAGLPVVIACTVQECTAERLPRLKQLGLGRVCWIEHGIMRATEL